MGVSLVTGGNGFIGDRIVARLVAAGVPVRVLARSSPQKRDSVEWFGKTW
ncbi:MAG: NAD-dependent epimerase/dehydratase family protein [Verrucomicrobiota bacterium]